MPTAASAACCCRLGTYRLTVTLAGFSTYTQEGIELVVGQTANIPIVLQLASVQEQITVTSDSPVVETTRAEQSTLINQQAMRGLPNNGRNFLSFMQLTPGVTIVQGPDGDEISVNGQKGINNNVSVDGADFNNPFFGEQRGGQRPAFTFNQDAIKEMVVVADGAAPEFGRSGGGFINVVTKSGTNAPADRRTSSSRPTGCRRRTPTARSSRSTSSSSARRSAARCEGPAVLLPGVRRAAVRPDQAAQPERASSRGSWTSSPASAVRTRTGPSTAPTTRACSWARWTTSSTSRTCSRSATTTPGASSRTARSTSTPGAAAPTPSSAASPTPSPARWPRRSPARC